MDIGKKLKEKRLEADYTQKDLAEILHVSRQTSRAIVVDAISGPPQAETRCAL